MNPAHPFLGTHQDNMDDMMRKGRHAATRHPLKLNPEQAKEIYLRVMAGESRHGVAREFRVSRQLVQNIAAGRKWTSVTSGLKAGPSVQAS